MNNNIEVSISVIIPIYNREEWILSIHGTQDVFLKNKLINKENTAWVY